MKSPPASSLLFAALLAITLALAGCSSGDGDNAANGAAANPTTTRIYTANKKNNNDISVIDGDAHFAAARLLGSPPSSLQSTMGCEGCKRRPSKRLPVCNAVHGVMNGQDHGFPTLSG